MKIHNAKILTLILSILSTTSVRLHAMDQKIAADAQAATVATVIPFALRQQAATPDTNLHQIIGAWKAHKTHHRTSPMTGPSIDHGSVGNTPPEIEVVIGDFPPQLDPKTLAAKFETKENDAETKIAAMNGHAPDTLNGLDNQNAENGRARALAVADERSRLEKFVDGYATGIKKCHIDKGLTVVYTVSSCMTLGSANYYRPSWGAFLTVTDALGTLTGLTMDRLKASVEKLTAHRNAFKLGSDKQEEAAFNHTDKDHTPAQPQNGGQRVAPLSKCELLKRSIMQDLTKARNFASRHVGKALAVISGTSAMYGLYKVSNPDHQPPIALLYIQGVYGLGMVGATLYIQYKDATKAQIVALKKQAQEQFAKIQAAWNPKTGQPTQECIDLSRRTTDSPPSKSIEPDHAELAQLRADTI